MNWICKSMICTNGSCCFVEPSSVYYTEGEAVGTIRRHREIEEMIEKDREIVGKTMKILLLGGPESGKSTIFKQMRILHLNGYSEAEIINFRYLIYHNVITSLYQLLEGARLLKILVNIEAQSDVDRFQNYCKNVPLQDQEMTPELGKIMEGIYRASFVKKVLERLHEFELLDSAIYFLERIKMIARIDYRPSVQDILRTRSQTTSIVEVEFMYKGYRLKMIDVGGQKSEQRKWIQCFDHVQAILFVADLSGYMQMLDDHNEKITLLNHKELRDLPDHANFGDDVDSHELDYETKKKIYRKNRLKYSRYLFRRIITNKCFFKHTTFLLFLNKTDIFKNRIKVVPLTICFKKYTGSNTFEETSTYIKDRFLAVNNNESLQIYTHFTNATDTDNIGIVFEECLTTVFKYSLKNVAFT